MQASGGSEDDQGGRYEREVEQTECQKHQKNNEHFQSLGRETPTTPQQQKRLPTPKGADGNYDFRYQGILQKTKRQPNLDGGDMAHKTAEKAEPMTLTS